MATVGGIPGWADLPRDCITCDGVGCEETSPGKRCSRCHTVYYCGEACQRRHWKEHKAFCVDVKDMRRRCAGLRDVDCKMGKAAAADTVADNDATCAICLESMMKNPVVLQPCGHLFCFSCIQQWQQFATSLRFTAVAPRQAEESKCPMCRSAVADVEVSALESARQLLTRAHRIDDQIKVGKMGGGDAQKEELRQHLCAEALKELDKVSQNDSDAGPHALQTMCTKAELLMISKRPSEAVSLWTRVLDLHQQGTQRSNQVMDLANRSREASQNGRDDEAEELMSQAEQMLQHSQGKMGRVDAEGEITLRFRLADAMVESQQLDGALDQYKSVFAAMEKVKANAVQQRILFMGLCRAFHLQGQYEDAIQFGKTAIEMNRHFPNVHKYVILSLMVSGKEQEALTMARRAVLYETPWDDDNRYQQWLHLQDLRSIPSGAEL